jgi:CubicO group peptidase (beta-lactamase class C family)
VFEHYYGDASPEKLHNIQSMTKSVSSALVGIALKKGLIKSLDNRALDYYPEYQSAITDQRVREITIRHLLTMASGIDKMQLSFDKVLSDPIAEILRQPLLYRPGGGFKYSSPAAHLLGGALRKATGRSVLDFAQTDPPRAPRQGERSTRHPAIPGSAGAVAGLLPLAQAERLAVPV